MTLTLESGFKVTGHPQLLSNLNIVWKVTHLGPKESKDASDMDFKQKTEMTLTSSLETRFIITSWLIIHPET